MTGKILPKQHNIDSHSALAYKWEGEVSIACRKEDESMFLASTQTDSHIATCDVQKDGLHM